MNIDRFEDAFSPTILERGMSYFADGHVAELFYEDDGVYIAHVMGSDLYEVEAVIDDSGAIKSITCDCPYEWDDHCKHQAAALCAIREYRRQAVPVSSGKTVKEPSLMELLSAQTNETLVQIIITLAQRDRTLKQTLLLRFGSPEREIEQCRKLVKESMKISSGYWHYGEVDGALEGAQVVLQRAQQYVQTDCERAVRLSLVVLPEAVALLDNCDDSSGAVGGVIDECAQTIADAFKHGWNGLAANQRTELFCLVLDEAQNDTCSGWFDTTSSLLHILVPCCEDAALRDMLYPVLERMGAGFSDEHSGYYDSTIATMQLELLMQWGAPGEGRQFLYEHLHFPNFRQKAIALAMEEGDYHDALSLAKEGLHKDGDYRSLLRDWRIAMYHAYEALCDRPHVLEMAEFFLLNERDGYDYYLVLEDGYDPIDWPRKREALLAAFEAQQYPQDAYVSILLEEGMFERLLALCQRMPERLPDLAKSFPPSFKAAVLNIYRELIIREASAASGRSAYKGVCRLIARMGRDVDNDSALDIIREFTIQYKRRPAFKDELKRISL